MFGKFPKIKGPFTLEEKTKAISIISKIFLFIKKKKIEQNEKTKGNR